MAKPYDVVSPVEYDAGSEKKTRWVRVGAAWPKDGEKWSIQLDALPVNGKLMIMPPRENGGQGGGF
jgi:hypothetical protein